MSDRHMLEMAARAYGGLEGFDAEERHPEGWHMVKRVPADPERGKSEYTVIVVWSPIDDDGDAFRLAVDLGFSVMVSSTRVAVHGSLGTGVAVSESFKSSEKMPTVRRAITRAAAAIGEKMP